MVLVDDPIDRGQAEPRALADFLRRKKRLENPGQRDLVHATSGVGDT